MSETLKTRSRMDAIQAPIVAVVADWIRQTPGTISLGQGVVHYPPPPEVAQWVARFADDAANHKYQPVQGIPALIEALTSKLTAENDIDPCDKCILFVTAGGNMA